MMRPRHTAFSLIELLVVVAIMSALLALSGIGFQGIRSGQNLKQAGETVVGQIALARQSAISRSARVRLMVYSVPDDRNGDPEAFRRMQLEIFDPVKREWVKHNRATTLPLNITFDPDRSPLFTNTSAGATNSVTFLPSGRTELDPNNKRNAAMTLFERGNSNNFITIQLDPVSGRCRTFQP